MTNVKKIIIFHFYVPNLLSDCTFSSPELFNDARLLLITYRKIYRYAIIYVLND